MFKPIEKIPTPVFRFHFSSVTCFVYSIVDSIFLLTILFVTGIFLLSTEIRIAVICRSSIKEHHPCPKNTLHTLRLHVYVNWLRTKSIQNCCLQGRTYLSTFLESFCRYTASEWRKLNCEVNRSKTSLHVLLNLLLVLVILKSIWLIVSTNTIPITVWSQ